ncbi:MAG: twin-arginine translocase TatA/TatE family subunit [Actinomycetes bacterium]
MHLPSLTEFLVIGFIGIVLLGPDKLPGFARQVGGLWSAIKDYQNRIESGFREQIPNLPSTTEMARMARSPVSLLNKLADFDVSSEKVREDPGATAVEHDDAFPADPGAPSDEVDDAEVVRPQTPKPPSGGFGDPSLN